MINSRKRERAFHHRSSQRIEKTVKRDGHDLFGKPCVRFIISNSSYRNLADNIFL